MLFRKHDCDELSVLAALSESELSSVVSFSIGHRKRLWNYLSALRNQDNRRNESRVIKGGKKTKSISHKTGANSPLSAAFTSSEDDTSSSSDDEEIEEEHIRPGNGTVRPIQSGSGGGSGDTAELRQKKSVAIHEGLVGEDGRKLVQY